MRFLVKVKPNASVNKVIKTSDNQFEVFTTAPAKEGRANKAVIDLLAEYLKIAPSRIELIKGQKNKEKIFEIL